MTKDFIAQWRETRKSNYRSSPADMIGAYNRENETQKDYRGRELLELIQNANDAGKSYSLTCRLKIVLTPQGVCVANTGEPFSEAGIASLLVSHNSPKRWGNYVGCKGLGFRSVLNWSSQPMVLSGEWNIGFGRDRANEFFLDIAEGASDAFHEATKSDLEHGNLPLAILEAPTDVTDAPDATDPLLAVARTLRREGFDTVIALPFTNPDVTLPLIEEQLADIGAETLLFLPYLREITVCREEEEAYVWRCEPSGEDLETVLLWENGATRRWRVWTYEANLPLVDDNTTPQKFALRLARPEDGALMPQSLYSFLPTKICFPYPILAHATVDLVSNRNQLQQTDQNGIVIKALGRFLAQIAAEIATPEDPWAGVALLAATESPGEDLQSLGFADALRTEIRVQALVPTHGGAICPPAQARWLEGAYNRRIPAHDWLPVTGLQMVVAPVPTSAFAATLSGWDIPILSPAELGARLDRVSEGLSVPERADLVHRLITERVALEDPLPALLADSANTPIPATSRVFLPPTGDETLSPEIFGDDNGIRFVGAALVTDLSERFGNPSREHLVHYLKPFSVYVFRLATVARAIAATTNAQITEATTPEDEARYRRRALQQLWQAFSRSKDSDNFPADVPVFVPVQDGTYRRANQGYLSETYPGGALTHALYGGFAPERLVVAPESLGIDGITPGEAERFLRWLGVEGLPQLIPVQTLPNDYESFVFDQFSYPLSTDDYSRHVPSRRSWCLNHEIRDHRFRDVQTFDLLPKIIAHAEPEAIAAWLILDNQWRERRDKGDVSASLYVWFPYGKEGKRVSAMIPCLALHQLETSAWLPVQGRDEKRRPGDCLLGRTASESLRSLFPRPELQANHPLWQRLGVTRQKAEEALTLAGVRRDLTDLSKQEIYALLLTLPERDAEGSTAINLYNALIDAHEEGSEDEPTRQRFIENGYLWGRLGEAGEAYYPVSELRYVERGSVPKVIEQAVPMLRVSQGIGAAKVRDLFGVATLDRSDIAVVVESVQEQQVSDLRQSCEAAKPFLLAWLRHNNAQKESSSLIRSLSIESAERIQGVARYGEAATPFDLSSENETLLVQRDGVYVGYVVCGATAVIDDPVTADAVASLFAERLQLSSRRGEFAQLLAAASHRRQALLHHWIGEETITLLNAARKELGSEVVTVFDAPYVSPPIKPVLPPANTQESQTGSGAILPTAPIGAVSVEPDTLKGMTPRQPVANRVMTQTASGMPTHRQDRLVTDGSRCETLVMRLEEAENRFPLLVGSQQGRTAFGCDVISFSTQADRAEFEETSDRNLIARFIEVKGRSSARGGVELTENEWRRAQEYNIRYFLYRVYEEADNVFDVVLQQNPANQKTDVIHTINPFATGTAVRLRVSSY